jgi:hypothetical protein
MNSWPRRECDPHIYFSGFGLPFLGYAPTGMPVVHQWHHQDIAHIDYDYPQELEQDGTFQPCTSILCLRKGEPRSIFYGDPYHSFPSERGEVSIDYGNILTMNNRVVHCGKTYDSVPRKEWQ